MDKTVTIKFSPGDTVRFKHDPQGSGIVTRVMLGGENKEYETAWMHNGEKKLAWFAEFELTEDKDIPAIGFRSEVEKTCG